MASDGTYLSKFLGRYSLKTILISVFGLLLLSGVIVNIFMVLNSGNRIVNQIAIELADNKSRETLNEITRFLNTPDVINKNTIRSINSSRVDLDDTKNILKFFWDLSEREEAYSVSGVYVGDQSGTFTGMEVGHSSRDPNRWAISYSGPATKGLYTDYQFHPESIIGPQLQQLGAYDPRVRPWYLAASATPDSSIWTDVYLDFDTRSPTITRAAAITNDSGDVIAVAGVDLFLSHLQNFLRSLSVSINTEVFVADGNGALLAFSSPSYEGAPIEHTVEAVNSNLRFTQEIGQLVSSKFEKFGNIESSYSETISLGNDEVGRLNLSPIGRAQGVDWTFGIFVPRSDYLDGMTSYLKNLAPFIILSMLLTLGFIYVFSRLVTQSLTRLDLNARAIASGDFDTDINIHSTKEITELGNSINHMRMQIREQVDQLAAQKSQFESILKSTTDGVITADQHGIVTYMNPVAEQKIGLGSEEGLGKPLDAVFSKTDIRSWQTNSSQKTEESLFGGAEVMLLDIHGDSHPIHSHVEPILSENGENNGSLMVFSDLSEKLQLKTDLLHQASHDALTGLVNRREFELRVQHLLQAPSSHESEHAVCYMDLDQFKVVNDSCGHVAGDELLKQIATLFETSIRKTDTIARLGGDEFGLLLEKCSLQEAKAISQVLLNKVSKFRFYWEEMQFNVGISIGIVPINQQTVSVTEALRDADSACYIAKDKGRNQVQLINDQDEQLFKRRQEMHWVDKINRALDQDTFELFAQLIVPLQVSVNDGLHFEVLVRMKDSCGSDLIPPGAFLPAAERYNLANKIDQWVVTNTFNWLEKNPYVLDYLELCSINLSGQSLSDREFLPFLLNAMKRANIPPQKLCFEVTETATIANLSRALDLIHALKQEGASFALDDFGSGLSSFEYLKKLPVDFLKIDGMFVKDMLSDKLDFAMVKSINEIGQTIGIKTIAEFVESTEIEDELRALGVDFAQGYGVSEPAAIDRILEYAPSLDQTQVI